MPTNPIKAFMDPGVNPLKRLPAKVKFQIMFQLSWMWSLIFTAWIGYIQFFGYTVAGHVILLIGIFGTKYIFQRGEKRDPAYSPRQRPWT